MGRHPGEARVDDAFGAGVCRPDTVASVMTRGLSKITAIDGIGCPGFADRGLFVDEYSGSRRRDWSAVKVKGSVDLGVSGEAWVDAGAAEEVDGDQCLREKMVQQIEREAGVGAAEACDEVVFEGSDGPFGGVPAMDVWRGKLEIEVLGVHELLEGDEGFVVEALEAGTEAA